MIVRKIEDIERENELNDNDALSKRMQIEAHKIRFASILNFLIKHPKLYWCLSLISYPIDKYVMKKTWELFIIDLDKSPTLIEWLDKNDFELRDECLIKKDIIEPETYHDTVKFDVLPSIIKSEMGEVIESKFVEYINFPAKKYLSLSCYVERIDSNKVYTLMLHPKRYFTVADNKQSFIAHLITLTFMIIVLSIIAVMI